MFLHHKVSETFLANIKRLIATFHLSKLMNSKNAYGGYIGDVPYIVLLFWLKDSLNEVIILEVGTGDWESAVSKTVLQLCEKDGYHLAK